MGFIMFLVFMLLLFQTNDAFGDEVGEDVCAPIVIDSTASRTTVFNEARAAYMRGCHTAALSAFETFTSAPPQPVDALHLKGLVFLGEVAYKIGDRERSLQSFQMVLDIQPDYKISLIDHDPEAVSLFNLARALPRQNHSRNRYRILKLQPHAPCHSGRTPFGIPQLRDGRVAQGTACSAAGYRRVLKHWHVYPHQSKMGPSV